MELDMTEPNNRFVDRQAKFNTLWTEHFGNVNTVSKIKAKKFILVCLKDIHHEIIENVLKELESFPDPVDKILLQFQYTMSLSENPIYVEKERLTSNIETLINK